MNKTEDITNDIPEIERLKIQIDIFKKEQKSELLIGLKKYNEIYSKIPASATYTLATQDHPSAPYETSTHKYKDDLDNLSALEKDPSKIDFDELAHSLTSADSYLNRHNLSGNVEGENNDLLFKYNDLKDKISYLSEQVGELQIEANKEKNKDLFSKVDSVVRMAETLEYMAKSGKLNAGSLGLVLEGQKFVEGKGGSVYSLGPFRTYQFQNSTKAIDKLKLADSSDKVDSAIKKVQESLDDLGVGKVFKMKTEKILSPNDTPNDTPKAPGIR